MTLVGLNAAADQLQIAREFAVLGDYDTARVYYQGVLTQVSRCAPVPSIFQIRSPGPNLSRARPPALRPRPEPAPPPRFSATVAGTCTTRSSMPARIRFAWDGGARSSGSSPTSSRL